MPQNFEEILYHYGHEWKHHEQLTRKPEKVSIICMSCYKGCRKSLCCKGIDVNKAAKKVKIIYFTDHT